MPVAIPDDAEWADTAIVDPLARFGTISSQLKQFVDALCGLWEQGKFVNKVYNCLATGATARGGQEYTLLALHHSIHHSGGTTVPPGYTDPVNPWMTRLATPPATRPSDARGCPHGGDGSPRCPRN
ncbi:NAD(P)H-dependent oxidoreductase [Streptomyces sp. NPDC052107]|uniref:NAD(P)H-dependent oxidoreductase n=1 Tax=Streptomyces sp. NPDC052107 TaxID=3155632 RepID=UPI003431694B